VINHSDGNVINQRVAQHRRRYRADHRHSRNLGPGLRPRATRSRTNVQASRESSREARDDDFCRPPINARNGGQWSRITARGLPNSLCARQDESIADAALNKPVRRCAAT
jgi:hypothetical protein